MSTCPTVGGVDDKGVVAAIRRGDPGGLEAAYDAYADRLFAFCQSMLRDQDAAADAVHDTFVIASQRVGQLREPERFRPWLYAIARNECLRQLRTRRRVTALDEAGDVRDETVNLERDLREEELRRLVWSAATGLNPRERSALELSLRHGLAGRELADALGVTQGHMNTLLTRARQQLERSLAAVIVARTGRDECPELREIVSGWDGELTVLMRKRLSRHIDNCEVCGARKRQDVSASALLSAVPLLAAPLALRDRVAATMRSPQLVAYRRDVGQRAGRFDKDGFPAARAGRLPSFGSWQWTAAAVVLLLLAGGGTAAAWKMAGTGRSRQAAQTAPVPSPTTSPYDFGPATPTLTPTPTLTATPSSQAATPAETPHSVPQPPTVHPVTPSATPTPTPTPKPTPPPPAPGRLRVDPTILAVGTADSGTVTLTAVGGPVSWTARPLSTSLTIGPASGQLAPGKSQEMTIVVTRPDGQETTMRGQVEITPKDGDPVRVTVTWDPIIIG